jgi:peptidoglycan/xylan/chitin deacetylase (PgdA/CDA1 family)
MKSGTYLRIALALAALVLPFRSEGAAAAGGKAGISILAYHRFGPNVADSMTVTTPLFEQQLGWLTEHGYRIVPLRALVDGLGGNGPPLPQHAVVITVDDGHRTVYSELFPLVRKYRLPVTLFIYPSAISNASYALTWEQIAEMVATGLVDIQSHTVWHPNFKQEKAKLSPADYRAFVQTQLVRSRKTLTAHGGRNVDMLAWPFGIYDPDLERAAGEAGYVAAFSIDRRPACHGDDIMSLPRYLMTDQDRGTRFAAIVESACR